MPDVDSITRLLVDAARATNMPVPGTERRALSTLQRNRFCGVNRSA